MSKKKRKKKQEELKVYAYPIGYKFFD